MRFLLCAKALYPSTAYNSFNYCTCVCQWLSVHCWRLFFIYITIREFKCKTTMPQLVIFKFARFLHSTNHSILLQSKNTSRIIKKKLNVILNNNNNDSERLNLWMKQYTIQSTNNNRSLLCATLRLLILYFIDVNDLVFVEMRRPSAGGSMFNETQVRRTWNTK